MDTGAHDFTVQVSGTQCRGVEELQGHPDTDDTANITCMVVFTPPPPLGGIPGHP